MYLLVFPYHVQYVIPKALSASAIDYLAWLRSLQCVTNIPGLYLLLKFLFICLPIVLAKDKSPSSLPTFNLIQLNSLSFWICDTLIDN